jgi:hypothetical protein
MKNLMRILFVLLLLALTCHYELLASDYIVYDVFNNKEIKFISKYKEVQSVQLNLSVEVDVTYFGFDSSGFSVKESINKKISELSINDWTTENGSQKIRNELKQRVANYLEIINSSRKYRNGYYTNKFEYSPSIKSIDCKPVSVYQNYLMFSLNYEFNLNGNQDYIDDELVISHYYKVNLITGEVSQVVNNLNQSQLELISKRLSQKFNDKYLLQTAKLNQDELIDYNDDEEEEYGINIKDENGVVCKDICEKINFKEADFIWYGWGVEISFQDYTRSSSIYNGRSFGLFLPYNECFLISDILQDFKFTSLLKTPRTSLKDFSYFNLIKKFNDLNIIPPIEKVVADNALRSKKVKTINIESYQLFDNDQKNFRGIFIYDLDTQGNLLSKSTSNEKSKPIAFDVYTYSNTGKLKSLQSKGNKSSEVYFYDNLGNLLEKSIQDPYGITDTRFFYNENYVYMIEEQGKDFVSHENIKKIKIGKEEWCLWNSCYLLDKNLRPLGIKSNTGRYEQFQIGHDEKGRVIETHRDFDRYHNYFNYDSLDRIVSFQTYDSQNPTMVIDYFYEGAEMLPFQQIKRSIQSGTVEMEKYSYEYFD